MPAGRPPPPALQSRSLRLPKLLLPLFSLSPPTRPASTTPLWRSPFGLCPVPPDSCPDESSLNQPAFHLARFSAPRPHPTRLPAAPAAVPDSPSRTAPPAPASRSAFHPPRAESHPGWPCKPSPAWSRPASATPP